ncbi:large ribosomal subunit protein mL45-like [Crassostrea virginica]
MANMRTFMMIAHRGSYNRLAASVQLLQNGAATFPCFKSQERSRFSSPQMPPNPVVKFKKERARKIMKQPHEFIEEKPDKYKVRQPNHVYTMQREIGITTFGDVMNRHIPLERDSKHLLTAKERVTASRKDLGERIRKIRSIRLIKKYDVTFNMKEFLATAHYIYIQSHKCIERIRENQDELMEYVNQYVYGQMTKGMMDKTLQWEFIESLEQPKVVSAGVGSVLSKDNIFGQLTVRFHTLQKLAIYNRFGRLIYGDSEKPRYVLEYVVFEKHVSDTEGKWRIVGKVTPEWKSSSSFTFLHTWKEDSEKPAGEGDQEKETEPYVIHRYNPEYPDEMTNLEEMKYEQTDSVNNLSAQNDNISKV